MGAVKPPNKIMQPMTTITPEIQKQIDMQILIGRINSWGRKIVEGEQGYSVESAFTSTKKLKVISDFKELEQGCELWIENEKYPMRCNPQADRVANIAQFKKIITTVNDSFKGSGIVGKIISLIYWKLNWKYFFNFIWDGMRDSYLPDVKFHSQPVREIYRLIDDKKLRDVVCAILEFDTAYRYRFQDIVGELNKTQFNKNPIKELKRLATILLEREQGTGGATKRFEKIIGLGLIYLRCNWKLLRKLKDFINKLNIEEIELSVEDIYWVTNDNFADYNFKGLNFVERNELHKKLI